MLARRTELLFVGAFLLACCAGVVFVFVMLRGPGRAFHADEPLVSTPLPRAPSPRAPEEAPPANPAPDSKEKPVLVVPVAPAQEEGGAAGGEEKEPAEAEGKEKNTEGFADLVLEIVPPAEALDRTVHVRVVDTAGTPVVRALVVVRQGTTILYRVRTDPAGEAVFPPYEEEEGPFRIDALAHGFVPGNAPSVAAGAQTEIVLAYRPVVEGKVRGAEGRRGVVRLFQGADERTVPIEPDGSFVFEELDPGQTTVQAEVDLYGTDMEDFFLEAGTRHFVGLRIRTSNAAMIQGSVGGWPGEGEMRINGLVATVRPSGNYTFPNAIIGLNEVLIDAPGRALLRERFTVRTLQMSIYSFQTRHEATIRGRVRKMFTNEAVAGAEVRVGFDRGDPRNDRVLLFPIERVPVVTTDDAGRFEITRLDPRLIYLVSVVAKGFGQRLIEVVPSGGVLVVKLPEGPFVFGKLKAVGGIPHDAVVTAVPLEGRPTGRLFNKVGWEEARSERDRDGFYGLSGLLPGPHLIHVEAPGFGSVETVLDLHEDERIRLDLRVRPGLETDPDEAALLERLPPASIEEPLAPGFDATLLKIDARRPVHEPPLKGVKVRFFDKEKEFAPPMDFDGGEVQLVGLPEATYRAILTHPALARPIVRDRIVLHRGVAVEIEMR